MTNPSKDAFTVLLKPHLERLYRLAYRLTSNVADAEDLVQDVIVKLYVRRDELTSIRELSVWLGRVLYNQFVDDKRRYGRQPLKLVDPRIAVEEEVSSTDEPLTEALNADVATSLTRALAKLGEDHRVVVLLHDSEGYKLKEIQELTGIPVGTLKSRLHRGRERLRALLKKDGTFGVQNSCMPMNGAKTDAL
jgi:RNA polymerase sigma-70 factor (ECF subfamily)